MHAVLFKRADRTDANGTVLGFGQESTLEDTIGSHACSLEASRHVANGIPLGVSLLLPVDPVNSVQTLKVMGQYRPALVMNSGALQPAAPAPVPAPAPAPVPQGEVTPAPDTTTQYVNPCSGKTTNNYCFGRGIPNGGVPVFAPWIKALRVGLDVV
jgi:hypothetical protein